MFKRRRVIVLFIFILFASLFLYNKQPIIHSTSAILMDASTGEILYEKNSDIVAPVASMSKLMTELLVLDAINSEVIHWEDPVTVTESANHLEEMAIALPVESGDRLTVKDLFTAMVITSANNATIALAEHIAGTEAAFTTLMNEKAVEIGLSQEAIFVNSTELPESRHPSEENNMSAKDVALLIQYLLEYHFEDVIAVSSMQQYHLMSHSIDLYTTNEMLNKNSESYVLGVDGLKTGYTSAAGYCFSSTASQNDRRLITVIMDAESNEERFIETKKLLLFGFDQFTYPSLKDIGKSLLKITKGS